MIESLNKFEERYQLLSDELSSGKLDFNSKEYLDTIREHKNLQHLIGLFQNLKKLHQEIEDTDTLIKVEKDKDIRDMAILEKTELEEKYQQLELDIKYALLPKDPNSGKNIIMEIRAGTGGDESALFAADLYRMYTRYAERNKWKVELLTSNPTGQGGYKEVIVTIEGKEVYDKLKYEAGTHRVQRIPVTESSGRIHTSAATVAVLPEVEETDIEINPADLKVDYYRSSGPGGQHVNTTDSAVRLTHVPTGIVVTCQDEKSQHKNKAQAMKVLRARLQEVYEKEQHESQASERRSQVKTGDRSERIRTYNFPQNRITDHRINYSIYNKMVNFLDGEIDELINALDKTDKEDALKKATSVN